MSKHRNQEMNRQRPQETNDDMSWELESKLEPGMLRFLAHVIENGLQARLRTQEDFIRHFSPHDIMQGLAERPDLRANILVPTTGVRPKIASKKNAESAGEDLQIALDEGETDATLIVSLFHPDDRVRYLDTARLWNYIIEPKFWTREKGNGEEFEQAKSHLAFILDRAIEDRMLTYRDIVDGITVGQMVRYLPVEEMQSVIEKALSNSHSNKAFTEQDMLGVVPTRKLVEYLPLSVIWNSVVCPKIAERNEFANSDSNAASNKSWNGSGNSAAQGLDDSQTPAAPGISNGISDTVEKESAHATTK